jgi:hypothetical protein
VKEREWEQGKGSNWGIWGWEIGNLYLTLVEIIVIMISIKLLN